MTVGVYLTVVVCIASALGYIRWFGSVHPSFASGVIGYSVGSVLSSYAFKLSVDHQLAFNYTPTIVAEALSFTLNTLCQVLLIKVLGLDSVLSFGLVNTLYYAVQVAVMVYYSTLAVRPQQDVDLGLSLKPYRDSQGRQQYLFDGALWFSCQLAYNTLLVDFFDQTFFVVFVQSKLVLGELTLIRGFGNLLIRYVYGPVGDVTYNLYAKIHVESRSAGSEALSREGMGRVASIVQGVMFVFAFLNYLLFAYSFNTCELWLRLFLGDKWVSPVGRAHQAFAEAFLCYVPVLLCVGVVGHVESLAKALVDGPRMRKFSRLNTYWLFWYFFVLLFCQTYGTRGIFAANVVHLSVRTAISAHLVASMYQELSPRRIFKGFLATPLESLLFLLPILLTGVFRWLSLPPALLLGSTALLGLCHCVLLFKLRSAYVQRLRSLIFD